MKYEIGEYWLTREKIEMRLFRNQEPAKIHYLGYVEGSATGITFDTYDEAMDEIRKKMREDEETGRRERNLKDGDLIIYFTAGWEEQSIYLKMHIAGTYDKETLDIVHEYDDRIIVEEF